MIDGAARSMLMGRAAGLGGLVGERGRTGRQGRDPAAGGGEGMGQDMAAGGEEGEELEQGRGGTRRVWKQGDWDGTQLRGKIGRLEWKG